MTNLSPRHLAAAIAFAMAHTHGYSHIGPPELEQDVAECSGQNFNTYTCAKGIERKVLAESQGSAKRIGGQLTLRTKAKTVILVDKPSESDGESIAYSYLGFIKSIDSHVLYVQYYEGGQYMVISHRSGQGAYPSGYPISSPDKKYFLSISEDLFAGYDPNNVEVWKVTSTSYQRLANFEPKWGPRSGKWINAQGARIEKVCHVPTESEPAAIVPCGFVKVLRVKSSWKLSE